MLTTSARVGALHPRTPDYATLPVLEGFDWNDCLAEAGLGPWFVVLFRSVRRADAPHDVLTEFDNLAHDEALASGGLLLYFRGEPDGDRHCLSLCIWTDQASAHVALRLPRHQAAVRIAAQMYESFRLERHWLQKARDGAITAEAL